MEVKWKMLYHSSREEGNERYVARHDADKILMMVLPVWEDFAERTSSSLFVERLKEEIQLLLITPKTLYIKKNNLDLKLALGFATHISVSIEENELHLRVSY